MRTHASSNREAGTVNDRFNIHFIVNLKTWIAPVLGVLLMLVIAPAFLVAQVDTGSISGTVADISGAVIPNATITLVNSAWAHP